MDSSSAPVVVVGAGISGVACARALDQAGVPVVLLDRGHRVGGRMASKRLGERSVDLGASYFTVSDDRFAAVVEDWRAAGLAREWTDTFEVRGPGEAPTRKSGPVRWAAPGALRSLVEALAEGLDLRREAVTRVTREAGDGQLQVDGTPAAAVVLAMPDAQAASLLGAGLEDLSDSLDRAWEPVLALVATYAERSWPADFDGAFVHDDADIEWIADDGRRRGDDAPVLVAHSTSERAARHLDDPDSATHALVAALRRVMQLDEPAETLVKRWSLAKPAGRREAPHLLDDRLLGVCGDGWGTPKVEGAYLSGRTLGEALVERLA